MMMMVMGMDGDGGDEKWMICSLFAAEKPDDESDSEGETYEDYLYQKTKDFNEQSRDPSKMKDVKFWASFIEFQDQSGDYSKARPAAVLEKKLSIYEKALDNIPKSEALLVGYLQTAEKLYEYPSSP